MECHRTGERGLPTFDINSRAGLGAFHSGLGHAQYSGVLATLGLLLLTPQNYKHREREWQGSGSSCETKLRDIYRGGEEEVKVSDL